MAIGSPADEPPTAGRFPDLVPRKLRLRWKAEGIYPDVDVFEMFARHVARTPTGDAVVDEAGPVSYGELEQLALRLAAGLLRLGVRPGDVVAHQLANSRWCCVADLAVAVVGAVVVPFPVGRGDRDVRSVLRRSRAVAIIVAETYADVDLVEMYRRLRAELPDLRHVVVHGTRSPDDGAVSLRSLLDQAPATRAQLPRVHPDAAARILISSGSESEPKLVAYSHNALFGGRGRYVERIVVPGHPLRILFLVPLATSWGSLGTFVTIAWLGGTVIVRPQFTVDGTWDAVERDRPSHLFGVPTMLHRLIASSRVHDLDLSSLQVVHSGAAPIDPATIARYRDEIDAVFLTGYGSSDGLNCINDLDAPLTVQQETVGRPDPRICAIRIVDERGVDVPDGEPGEIYGRGPFSPLCYVDAPELDVRYRTNDGWVRSGDRGWIDTDGRLHLVGRQREMILRGGKNVSPAEVEAVVAAHPDVVSVACVGVPDVDLGQRVGVCVTQRPGTAGLTREALASFLASDGIEPVKFPEVVVVLPELPLSPAGKIDKPWLAALVAEHAAGRQATPTAAHPAERG